MLCLHGVDERGGSYGKRIDHVMKSGPWNEPTAKKFCIVAPQCHTRETWPGIVADLAELVEKVCEMYPIDRRRCYAMGHSMGAFGCWALASRKPDLFAGLVSISGGYAPVMPKKTTLKEVFKQATEPVKLSDQKALRRIPAWLFHGINDPIVNIKAAEGLYRTLGGRGRGDSLRLLILKDQGHQCWDRSYAEPGLFEWLKQVQATHKQPRPAARGEMSQPLVLLKRPAGTKRRATDSRAGKTKRPATGTEPRVVLRGSSKKKKATGIKKQQQEQEKTEEGKNNKRTEEEATGQEKGKKKRQAKKKRQGQGQNKEEKTGTEHT